MTSAGHEQGVTVLADSGQRTEPTVSVVIPARNAAGTIGECLRAVRAQSLAADRREVIVIVDGRSHDATEQIARELGATVIVQGQTGAGGARNQGVRAARGTWIAFTDADCVPTRGWLRALIAAVDADSPTGSLALGAAGPTIGIESHTAAARFVDLTGGLQAERHLAHARYPWAPTANVLYRRAALLEVGGFDSRFVSYEGCDLHTRLLRSVGGRFELAPRALVYHRHRAGWRAYWRQQLNYGRGYAQFFLRYRDELPWNGSDEARSWLGLGSAGIRALVSANGDRGLVRRGTFVKALAQRIGFATTYWRAEEAERWRSALGTSVEQAS